MKKEVFLAITIGFVLGLIITYGIYTANKSLKNLPQGTVASTPSIAPEVSASPSEIPAPTSTPGEFSLLISEPADESLVTKNSVSVSGTTVPASAVAILSETGETLTVADSAGKFTATVSLEGGFNRLVVTAYDSTGKSATQTVMVTYTSAQI